MCTSIQMSAADGTLLLARTMDWHASSPGPTYLAQDYSWRAIYNGQAVSHRHAILGVGHARVAGIGHADISDGVNDAGLALQKLTFSQSSEFATTAVAGALQLAAFELPLYLLGTCATVAEVAAALPGIQLMTDAHSAYKFGFPDLHFTAADRTGAMISIEPRSGVLQVVDNPIGVVTNAPDFAREVAKLADYLTLAPAGTGLPRNRISTGIFNGKKTMPGGFTPTARFIRATLLRERSVTPADESEAVVALWHLLNAVTVPQSDGRSSTHTIYRSAVSLSSRRLYFEAYNDLTVSHYDFETAADNPELDRLVG